MKKISVIVCNNGLGHLKRVLHVLKEFTITENTSDMEFNVFVDEDKLKFFSSIINLLKKLNLNFNIIDFKSDLSSSEKDFLVQYKDYFDSSDYVWSDNLAFPLKYHKNVFFTGSFLWSDVYRDLKSEEELLRDRRPLMIGSRYFATSRVRSLTNFDGVGIYNYSVIEDRDEVSKNILISCGYSDGGRKMFEQEIESIKDQINDLPNDTRIYLETDYCDKFQDCDNVHPATFDEEMFSSIGAAVIRPGMGTVSDVLSKGGRIFAFYEKDNEEVSYNAEIIESLQIGEKGTNLSDALSRAVRYLADSDLQNQHRKKIKDLEFDGVIQTATKIGEILANNG